MVTGEIRNELDRLKTGRIALIEYLKSKVASEDWHAVSDAAIDLRVLDAEIEFQLKRGSE